MKLEITNDLNNWCVVKSQKCSASVAYKEQNTNTPRDARIVSMQSCVMLSASGVPQPARQWPLQLAPNNRISPERPPSIWRRGRKVGGQTRAMNYRSKPSPSAEKHLVRLFSFSTQPPRRAPRGSPPKRLSLPCTSRHIPGLRLTKVLVRGIRQTRVRGTFIT